MKRQKHLYRLRLAPAFLALMMTVASCSSTTSESVSTTSLASTTVPTARVDDPLEVTVLAQDVTRFIQTAPRTQVAPPGNQVSSELIYQMALQGRLPMGARVHLPGVDGLRIPLWDGYKAAPALEVFAAVPGKVELSLSGYSVCLTIESSPVETLSLSEPVVGELACKW